MRRDENFFILLFLFIYLFFSCISLCEYIRTEEVRRVAGVQKIIEVMMK